MKKLRFNLFLLMVAVVLIFTSCNSMESDAKKLAKMHYELDQVGNNVGSTSNTYKEKAKGVFEFETKTWKKYSKNPETKKEFRETFDAELKKLKGR